MLKNLLFLCLVAHSMMQSSALYRAWQPIAAATRRAYVRGADNLRPYMRQYTTCNKNMQLRPWSNRIANVARNAWAKPAVMTGLAAGAGLGTYCLTRSPVFAQENVAPEVRAFLQEAQNITNSLRNELPTCTDYACANIIFNKSENLIGILLHNEHEGVSLQGDHQSAVKYLLQDALAVKKAAVAKALDFAQDKIWAMWHTPNRQIYYNQNLITNMLHHIGHYSGALFRYGLYPQGNNWVSIPPVYAQILAAIARDPMLKKQFVYDLSNYHNAALQSDDAVMSQALLAIINKVQSSLNI